MFNRKASQQKRAATLIPLILLPSVMFRCKPSQRMSDT